MVRHYFLLLLTLIMWATTFIFIKIALLDFSPGSIALYRNIVATLTVFTVFKIRRDDIPTLSNLKYFKIFLLGCLGFSLYNFLLDYSELLVPASVASFITSHTPIFTFFVSWLFFKTKINRFNVYGLILGSIGISILFISMGGSAKIFNLSSLASIGVVVCGGLYSLFQRNIIREINPLHFVFLALLLSNIILLPLFPYLIIDFNNSHLESNIAIILSGVFPGGIAYYLWSIILKKIEAYKAMSYFYLFPLISLFISIIYLNEYASYLGLCGMIVCTIATIIFNLKKNE